MEMFKQYEAAILEFYHEYIATYQNEDSQLIHQLVVDKERGQYMLLLIGWQEERFVYSLLFHLAIKDSKVWLQQNATDLLITDSLTEKGIPKSDIIIGFKPMFMNEYAGFGVV